MELELTRRPSDRRLYVLESVGTLRLLGFGSRAAMAEADGRTWLQPEPERARQLRGLRAGARLTEVGREIIDEDRKCPMCGGTKWILLDGVSTLMALEGGLEAIAYSCDECGFMRWHRLDKVES